MVGPKKAALKKAKAKLREAEEKLEAKREELRQIESHLAKLQVDEQSVDTMRTNDMDSVDAFKDSSRRNLSRAIPRSINHLVHLPDS